MTEHFELNQPMIAISISLKETNNFTQKFPQSLLTIKHLLSKQEIHMYLFCFVNTKLFYRMHADNMRPHRKKLVFFEPQTCGF